MKRKYEMWLEEGARHGFLKQLKMSFKHQVLKEVEEAARLGVKKRKMMKAKLFERREKKGRKLSNRE